jgi:hypothetical protein
VRVRDWRIQAIERFKSQYKNTKISKSVKELGHTGPPDFQPCSFQMNTTVGQHEESKLSEMLVLFGLYSAMHSEITHVSDAVISHVPFRPAVNVVVAHICTIVVAPRLAGKTAGVSACKSVVPDVQVSQGR